LHHAAAPLIGRVLLDLTADWDYQAVGGLTLGADPIGAAIAMASADTDRPIPMFIVRKEPKGHGTRQLIEGPFPDEPGAPVVIVDDVITKGGSVMKAISAVESETRANVVRVVLIVDREEGGADALARLGVRLHSLFRAAQVARNQ
jgi:orotate phosphoribosyltransferase